MQQARERMTMRSKTLLGLMILAALSVCADRPHDLFNAHRERILSKGVVAVEDFVFLVGQAKSPQKLGASVGWTKAEMLAKGRLVDRFKATAPWPPDVTEEEKSLGWMEYRALHPMRFSIAGMQTIWRDRPRPDLYTIVLAVPEAAVELAPPTEDALKKSIAIVRAHKRIKNEVELERLQPLDGGVMEKKGKAGDSEVKDGVLIQQQADESLIL